MFIYLLQASRYLGRKAGVDGHHCNAFSEGLPSPVHQLKEISFNNSQAARPVHPHAARASRFSIWPFAEDEGGGDFVKTLREQLANGCAVLLDPTVADVRGDED